MTTKKMLKKTILLTALGVFSFFGLSTYAINFDLIASNFVNKMQTKYSILSCDDQVKKMHYRSTKFEKINKSYSTNTKISRQQKMLISMLLQTIISKFESKIKILEYECVDITADTGSNVETRTGSNTGTSITDDQLSQINSLQKEMLNAVNIERQKYGKDILILDEKLNQASQKYAEYLYNINNGISYGSKDFRFSHTSKDGKDPFDRIKAEGYEFRAAGENLAVGQSTVEDVMKDLMNSEGHKKNILSEDFEEIGIGVYKNFWVQNFGKERE